MSERVAGSPDHYFDWRDVRDLLAAEGETTLVAKIDWRKRYVLVNEPLTVDEKRTLDLAYIRVEAHSL